MYSIKTILSLVVSLNLKIEQLYVKKAFMHGDLGETICIEQLERCEVKGKEKLMYKLKKSLYRLK